MPMFRKKPVVIEARQYTGNNHMDLIAWIGNDEDNRSRYMKLSFELSNQLIIPTLEGVHVANVGDWIIKGVAEEFYPCKPEIFSATYEEVQ